MTSGLAVVEEPERDGKSGVRKKTGKIGTKQNPKRFPSALQRGEKNLWISNSKCKKDVVYRRVKSTMGEKKNSNDQKG